MTDGRDARFDRPSGAVFSVCGHYRYALWRTWQPTQPRLLFVGLNPSRADEHRDDPTIRRCLAFARAWGFGSLLVGNLFAWRTPQPRALRQSEAPVGLENDRWLETLSGAAARILVGWGNHGRHLGRDRWFSETYRELWCLRMNRDGSPAHPLYIRKDQQPEAWAAARGALSSGAKYPAADPGA